MAFAIANRKNMKNSFSANQITPGTQVNGGSATGGSQPPRNRMVAIAHIVVIATYSPSMNNRYGVEPYSTMKPATSSDSASTRSNGARFVSASAETKNSTNIGNNGSQYQRSRPKRVFCASTMSVMRSEPTQSSTVIMTNPMETSYETICAAERSAARNGYFELDAQPAMITP